MLLPTKQDREMLNPRAVNVYGFVAIGAMTLMLVLVVGKIVPPRMYTALFYAAAALFAVRIVLRIALARQQKKEAEAKGEEKGGAEDT
jgi:Flp pilus assembly protein TadB